MKTATSMLCVGVVALSAFLEVKMKRCWEAAAAVLRGGGRLAA